MSVYLAVGTVSLFSVLKLSLKKVWLNILGYTLQWLMVPFILIDFIELLAEEYYFLGTHKESTAIIFITEALNMV